MVTAVDAASGVECGGDEGDGDVIIVAVGLIVAMMCVGSSIIIISSSSSLSSALRLGGEW